MQNYRPLQCDKVGGGAHLTLREAYNMGGAPGSGTFFLGV